MDDLVEWTSGQIRQLMPGLDGEYLTEAVKYSLSLSPDDTERHWRSLLGSAPQVDLFLKQLGDRRNPPKPKTKAQSTMSGPTTALHLHAPIPTSPSQSRVSSTDTSRTPSPSKVLRITSSKSVPSQRKKGPGKLTSELIKPKTKPPPANPLATAISEDRPLTEIEEIDSAIQSISLNSNKRRECGCFGTKHEVFPLAPNCLNCGRIICINEGIGKCFHCGEDLVSLEQREEVIKELRVERGVAKTKAANEKVRKVKAGEGRHRAWATKVGGQEYVYGTSDSEASPFASGYGSPIEHDSAYIEAERRRDELLDFDRTFAERTKIIDQQAEFTPQYTLTDKFSTPQERAAALRRLQQLEAEQAAAERARHRRVLEIDFKTGRGTIRNASAEDLLFDHSASSPTVPEITERNVSENVEIVNGFPKPTFVESS